LSPRIRNVTDMVAIAALRDWIETVSNLRLPPAADRRLQELMDRNNEGSLTEAERVYLEELVELSETLPLCARRHFLCWAASRSELA
jgi:hypothetical protein